MLRLQCCVRALHPGIAARVRSAPCTHTHLHAAAAAAAAAVINTHAGREKADLQRSAARALESVKATADAERSAWRAAVTEKLKRQAADREAQLRAALVRQRDEELALVVQRLEAEQEAARAAAAQQVCVEAPMHVLCMRACVCLLSAPDLTLRRVTLSHVENK